MRYRGLGVVFGSLAACVLTLTLLTGEVYALGVPGDANGDGVMTQADLNIVLENFNTVVVGLNKGDFDGNGTVNGADLNIVLSNMGGQTSVAGAVPEPATLGLLFTGLLGLLAFGCTSRVAEAVRAAFRPSESAVDPESQAARTQTPVR
jgi:hypothetical protein